MSSDRMRLRAIAAQARYIAEAIERFTPTDAATQPASLQVVASRIASSPRQIIRDRRERGRYFDAAIFGEPAWDMLLDLYAAELEQTMVSVSSLCIASGVPGTTALRHIQVLTNRGMVERHPDPFDKRRWYIKLAPVTRGKMERYLAGLVES